MKIHQSNHDSYLYLALPSEALNRHLLLFLLLSFISLRAVALQVQVKPPATEIIINEVQIQAFADSIANVLLQRDLVPGLTVALAKDGEIVFAKGYGKAELELNVPASSENIYRIGSITKQFTAAVILRLAEEGKISINDK